MYLHPLLQLNGCPVEPLDHRGSAMKSSWSAAEGRRLSAVNGYGVVLLVLVSSPASAPCDAAPAQDPDPEDGELGDHAGANVLTGCGGSRTTMPCGKIPADLGLEVLVPVPEVQAAVAGPGASQ
eukprot:g10386.t1